jgi:hypothetical protein
VKALIAVAAVTLVGATLVISGCEQGSYFHPNTKQIKSDSVSRVEAMGDDFRLYEFTPQTDPSRQCIFVAATQKGGVTCWKKGT